MKKNKLLKRSLIAIGSLLAIGIIAFVIWGSIAYQPDEALKNELSQPVGYQLDTKDNNHFIPNVDSTHTAVIIYPGGKVDALVYGQIAAGLAKQGYHVFIPDMPLHFAIFGVNKAAEIIKDHPEIETIYIGGHSLGGVMAASYANKHPEQLAGIFFMASYAMESESLADTDMKALSIYATLDGLVSREEWESSFANLPADAEKLEIEGGNHGGFGRYGKQSGDNDATISVEIQQNLIIEGLLDWIE